MDARPLLAAGLAALALIPTASAEARTRLRTFANCDQLVSYARSQAPKAPGQLTFEYPQPTSTAPVPGGVVSSPMGTSSASSPASAPTAAAPEDTSGTNVQEVGIDEPDMVKTDGRTIFAAVPGGIQAVDARAAQPALAGTLTLPDAARAKLLLHGDRLLVIASGSSPRPVAGTRSSAAGSVPSTVPGPVGFLTMVTTLTEVDVSNPAAMKVVRTTTVDGEFVDARQDGATARLVISSRPAPLPEPVASKGQTTASVIARSGVRTWVPSRRTVAANGAVGRLRKLVGCRRVRRPAVFSGLGMLTVLTVDLDRGLPAVDTDAIMTSADTVYAAPGSLYVATERYLDPNADYTSLSSYRATTINRFDASDPHRTTYVASGDLMGFLLNQFSISEDNGLLRVATTETPSWWEDGDVVTPESQSYVTVLEQRDGALVPVGRVGGIGVGERIQAVRFVGDTGFVVTYQQTDPLYTLDLSDPHAPKVAGKLDLLGYSAYLHPLGAGLLLGVGQAGDEAGNTLGTQVSVFDVSDAGHPRRVGEISGLNIVSSAAESDHHAFLYWPATRLVVIPTHAGAVGLRVAADGGLDHVGKIEPLHASSTLERSVVVGSRLFSVAEDGVVVTSLDKLTRLAGVDFPMPAAPKPAPSPVPYPTIGYPAAVR